MTMRSAMSNPAERRMFWMLCTNSRASPSCLSSGVMEVLMPTK